jgi:hypothetical protein
MAGKHHWRKGEEILEREPDSATGAKEEDSRAVLSIYSLHSLIEKGLETC